METPITTPASWVQTLKQRFVKYAQCLASFFPKLTLELTLALGIEGALYRAVALGIVLIVVAFAMHVHLDGQPRS